MVADVARADGWAIAGFVDASPEKIHTVVEPGGAAVIWTQAELFERLSSSPLPDVAFAVAVGHNRTRLNLIARLHELAATVPVITHPSSVVSSSAELGSGTVVMPNVVVNAAARVGRGCILNSGCVVEHDCELGDGVHVSPNATLAGAVRAGECSWIGAGATVIPGQTIGEGSVVGAGAVVVRAVPPDTTVVGVPAHPRSRRE